MFQRRHGRERNRETEVFVGRGRNLGAIFEQSGKVGTHESDSRSRDADRAEPLINDGRGTPRTNSVILET